MKQICHFFLAEMNFWSILYNIIVCYYYLGARKEKLLTLYVACTLGMLKEGKQATDKGLHPLGEPFISMSAKEGAKHLKEFFLEKKTFSFLNSCLKKLIFVYMK